MEYGIYLSCQKLLSFQFVILHILLSFLSLKINDFMEYRIYLSCQKLLSFQFVILLNNWFSYLLPLISNTNYC